MNVNDKSLRMDKSEIPSIFDMLLRVMDLLETLSEDERLQFITIEQMDTLKSCELLRVDIKVNDM